MIRQALSPRLLLCLLALSAVGHAAEVVRVWPGYRSAESFQTIGEFFGKKEYTGGRLVLRTQPENRNGYYFLTRIEKADAIPGATARVQLIFAGSPLAKTYEFPVAIPEGKSVLNLGITGSDWPGAGVKPLAWRVTLLRPDGSELLSEHSFLWAQP